MNMFRTQRPAPPDQLEAGEMARRYLTSLVVVASLLMALVAVAPFRAAAQTADPTEPFFDNAVLHNIYFTINSKDWQTLKENYLDNTYYPVDFKWGTTTVRNSGIRSRGTGSRSGEKPGLRLDFDRYTSNQKFLGLKSLVLRNSTQDPSNMHEQLSMLLFKKLGLAAPREIYARLYVNNAYAGLYSIVESIDKTFLGKTFGTDEGYLYKYDYNITDTGYYFQYRTSNPADYVPLPFKPETHESDPQPEVFEQFIRTINTASDASFRTSIAEFMDLTELVRHVAGEVFVADNDGFLGNWGMNNYYLYRFADEHRFRFVDWDKSEAFKDPPDYWIWHNHLDAAEATKNRLWTRAMAHADLKALFLDTLIRCADLAAEIPLDSAAGDSRGWLEREVDRQYELINLAVQADPQKPYTNDEFQAAVNSVRDFVQRRPGIVRSQVAASR
jgi:spore coat protein CotH